MHSRRIRGDAREGQGARCRAGAAPQDPELCPRLFLLVPRSHAGSDPRAREEIASGPALRERARRARDRRMNRARLPRPDVSTAYLQRVEPVSPGEFLRLLVLRADWRTAEQIAIAAIS